MLEEYGGIGSTTAEAQNSYDLAYGSTANIFACEGMLMLLTEIKVCHHESNASVFHEIWMLSPLSIYG